MKKTLVCACMLLALWLLLHSVAIIWDGLHDNIKQADVAVVLGNKIEPNGTPSMRLQGRLDKAIELYRQGWIKKIIVSGGREQNGYEEADVMRDYLVDHGIPAKNILLDKDGYDTYHTAQSTKRLMQENNLESAMIVSHYYHISRTKLAFSKFGIQNVTSAHAQVHLELREPYSILREFFGYYFYLLRNYPDA
jgi:vancomycin permeability regulator SanA